MLKNFEVMDTSFFLQKENINITSIKYKLFYCTLKSKIKCAHDLKKHERKNNKH